MDSDEDLQKTATTSSAITSVQNNPSNPNKSSPSETNFDRNNSNLMPSTTSALQTPSTSANQAPITMPLDRSNVSKFNPTEFSNYPSVNAPNVTTNQQQCVCAKCSCRKPFQSNTSSNDHSDLESSSSCSSISQHFPMTIKLNIKKQDVIANQILARLEKLNDSVDKTQVIGPRLHRLQPYDIEPLYLTTKTQFPEDNYFSCESALSDTEASAHTPKKKRSKTRSKNGQDDTILKLLNKIVHIIKERQTRKSSKYARTSPTVSSSKFMEQKSKDCIDPCKVLSSFLNELKNSYGPCKDLPSVAINATSSQTGESDSSSQEFSALLATKSSAEEDKESSSSESPKDRKQPTVPQCPCYNYFMALIAANQGKPLTISDMEGLVQLPSTIQPIVPSVQQVQKDEVIAMKSFKQSEENQDNATPQAIPVHDELEAVKSFHDNDDNTTVEVLIGEEKNRVEEEAYDKEENIVEEEAYDKDSELGKEKIAESSKQKEDNCSEFKYFIDSIIMDLDAMEHARRKCSMTKNLCMPKSECCTRDSFPVTITDVQDLGSTSLYVKWINHDCYGIGGYEIYVDGYLTNRYYHSRHDAAVITDVDVTIPHKISLVARPSLKDESMQMLCCPSYGSKQPLSIPTPASLWTPSIYLYDPDWCKKSPPKIKSIS